MRVFAGFLGVFLLTVCVAGAFGDEPKAAASEDIEEFFDVSKYGDDWLTADQNNDGMVDYAVKLNEDNQKTNEAMDFNYDGLMDDFYFYANEVLVREELDTNYDGAIDLWVYLHRGVYVERYERDTDYDGKPDIVKAYGANE